MGRIALSLTAPAPKVRTKDFCAVTQLVKIVRPVLHHSDPLIPIFSPRVGAAHRAGIELGELLFDSIGIPESHLVEQRRGHGPKAVRGHLLLAVPAQLDWRESAPTLWSVAVRRGAILCSSADGSKPRSRHSSSIDVSTTSDVLPDLPIYK